MQDSHYHTLSRIENIHWWFVAKRELIGSLIPTKAKEILDVGAGTGAMVGYLREKGYLATGIEPSKIGLTYSSKASLPIQYGVSHNIPTRDNQFDCVTCIDVLYHKNVKVSVSLQEMMRVLKPGGTLIVFDCAYNWLKGPHDLEVHGRERFTNKALCELIASANGQIIYASYFYFLFFPVIAISRLIQKIWGVHKPIKVPATVINNILGTIMSLERLAMSRISYPWGSSVVVVARKQMM